MPIIRIDGRQYEVEAGALAHLEGMHAIEPRAVRIGEQERVGLPDHSREAYVLGVIRDDQEIERTNQFYP